MVSNFLFLNKYWPELSEIGAAAESYLYSDPNACIFKIGMLAEQIVQGIFEYEKIELPEDNRQSNLIRVLKNNGLIPQNVNSILYAIRKARNDAVHKGSDSLDEAKILLESAYNLSVWYMEVYGEWTYAPQEYAEPTDISGQEDYKQKLEEHEKKIKELLEEVTRIKTEASESPVEVRREKSEDASQTIEVVLDKENYNCKNNVVIEAEVIPFLNYALIKNKIGIIRTLVIHNNSTEDYENVVFKISSIPDVCIPYERTIDTIPAGTSFELKEVKLFANVNYLGNLTEKTEACLSFALSQDEKEICNDNQTLTVLAFDQWHGSVFYPELLSAFVTPNAPVVGALIKRASEFLGNWTGDPSLDAYQSHDAERVMKQAAAVYATLQEQNITYAVPPASFEKAGQRVRLCDVVIDQKIGTCLDLSLLFASCLEAMGLNPILVVLEGHIFAGVWLEDYTFPDVVIDDASQVTKRLASGVDELIVVECTAFCTGKKISFDEACELADSEMKGIDKLQTVIDIKRARKSNITPLPSRILTENGYSFSDEQEAEYVTDAPHKTINSLDVDSSVSGGARTRKDLWERKLLDLGLRNKLINMTLKSVIPILTDSIDSIEDILADGDTLSIYPRPLDWHIFAKDLDFENMHDLGENARLIHSELDNKRLRSALSEGEVNTKLKSLYRDSKVSLEENGANTLYIALGLLKWFETDRSQKPRYAPLLLLPIEIIRKGGNQGYVIRMRDEEPQMNITILEKLKQDFQIKITGLETLPMDEHGIDTRKVFTIVRRGIMNQTRWDVLESAYVGVFSFSQFVMWNDIKNRADDLARNKIVRSLMEGKMVWEDEPMELGSYEPSNDLYLPISVDGSQMYAVDSASKGKSFILHGPPGTGKSQTITVMIANALAQGKTVLFVAEKMAALEVVQKRLNDIGLGPFCLELHSNKAKKKQVLEQLKLASEVVKGSNKEEYQRKLAGINEIKSSLDNYAKELHAIRYSGFSFFQMVDQYENYSDCKDIKDEGLPDVTSIDRLRFENLERIVERLIAAGKAVGHPNNHPLSMIGIREYSQQLKDEINASITSYRVSITEFRSALQTFVIYNGLECPLDYFDIFALISKCKQIDKWKDLPSSWMLLDNYSTFIDIDSLANQALTTNETKSFLLADWKEDYLKMPVNDLLLEYNKIATKWALPKAIGLKKMSKMLALYSNGPVDKKRIGDNLLLLKKYQDSNEQFEKLLEMYKETLSNAYRGENTDWKKMAENAGFAKENFEEFNRTFSGKDFIVGITQKVDNNNLIPLLLQAFENMTVHRREMDELLDIKTDKEDNDWINSQLELCDNISNHRDDLKEWITWNMLSYEAEQNGLKNIVDAYKSGMGHEDVLGAYHKAIYRHLAIGAINESAVLNSFSGALFEEQISQFKRIDKEITEQAKKAVYYILASNVPDFAREASKSSEVGILQRAIKSNGRAMSIRSLMDQISTLLPRLCPCMLMSPISAAQYLDPKREPFDLVIFDEASQLPTSKAVGALARGKEAVIVGDPKQMPPTSFFASNSFDEENSGSEDLESILDDCLALNMPETHLLWHYRSRHESLISFSNSQFYERKLYTFPSVNDRESKVTLVKVDGVFERGKSRQNRKEAELVVKEVIRRFKDKELNKFSVGIVTFNISQQNLIDDLLSEACVNDPGLESWVYNEKEPLFIKNLENVQGDERDVILFSVGYGPDENGKTYVNFGPLNRDGGWRRLNVAVSRARYEMKIFSSYSPDQIDLSRTQSEGVAALKHFLEYASGKPLLYDEESAKEIAESKSGIAGKIQEYLRDKGFDSDILIGNSEFKIDVGVIDPNNVDNYILGIVLDGDSYHAAKTTRDREVAQISVLIGLGWHIHRIWSMDWYDNHTKELNKILTILDDLKNGNGDNPNEEENGSLLESDAINIEPVQESEQVLLARNVQGQVFNPPIYSSTRLTNHILPGDAVLDYYGNEIMNKFTMVINYEGPVCESILFRRVASSFGIARVGSRIHAKFEQIIKKVGAIVTNQNSGRVYWPLGTTIDSFYIFRASGEGDNKRDSKDVPALEALNAICYVLYNDISVEEEDLIRESAKLLNYTRVGTGVSSLFLEALSYGVKLERLVKKDSKWMLTDSGNDFSKRMIKNMK